MTTQTIDGTLDKKEETSPYKDILMKALIWIGRYDQRLVDPYVIFEGFHAQRAMTLEDFALAASKLGYESTVVPMKLEELNDSILPCIALLNKDSACIITKKEGDRLFLVWLQGDQLEEKVIRVENLKIHATGEVLLLKPLFVEDDRSQQTHLVSENRWFWHVLKSTYPLYGEVFLASIFINVFAVLSSLFAMNVYDRVVPNAAYETLFTLSLGMTVAYIFDFLLKTSRSYFMDYINKKTDVRLTSMIFEHLMQLKLIAKPKSIGGFASMVSQFESFRDFFTSASLSIIIDLPFVLLFLGIMIFLGGNVVMATLLAIPLVAIVVLVTQYMSYDLIKKSMRLSSQKNSMLIEYVGALEAVKFWGAQKQLQYKWDSVITESAQVHGQLKTIQSYSSNLCQLIQSLSYVGLIVLGVMLILEKKMTMGALIGCSILSSRAIAPILQVGQLLMKWQQAKSSLDGMDQLMKMPIEYRKNALSVENIQGYFKLSDVSFVYPGMSQPTLKELNIEIRPGDKVGVVGTNGSGKSTLVKMLLGLYQPTNGYLLLDGIDLQQYQLTSLRKIVGYVPQDIHILHGTLRENITMGCSGVSQDNILKAAYAAGLMEFIGHHPQGLDMMISERGESLSGGQRQAIALARAILLSPSVLILDEPTSSLDFQAEAHFLERLKHITEDKTLIVISHRQAPLKLVNQLLVLHQGSLVKQQGWETAAAK